MVQLSSGFRAMRTVLVLAALVTLALAGAAPSYPKYSAIKTETVEPVVVQRQYKVLELLEVIHQVNIHADYYEVGKDYDIKAHMNDYNKNEVVEKFYYYYGNDFIPKYSIFSIFNEKMREQAKALYDLFYYAKDFDTFYKTAAWARIYVNGGMFAYSFYVATINREETAGFVLPPFYEIVPEYFVNSEIINKMHMTKMRGAPYGEYPENFNEANSFFYYSNYSNYYTYGDEYKLAYLTEDIGWNSFYAYFHALNPFWQESENLVHGTFRDRRGEVYFSYYQQLLARYYLERLSNGLGEIPRFSWYQPFKYGYRPFLASPFYPFVQRSENYIMQNEYNLDDLRFVRNYEDIFQSYLEKGQFKSYQREVDFYNSKSINFVGNFWQCNADLYEKVPKSNYYRSYEMAARRILSGSPVKYKFEDYDFTPSALDFYQTSLRDPAFYQLYNKIVGFMLKYKQYLQPYSQENLHYVGVKINNLEVSRLETFFDLYTFNASNSMSWSNEELSNKQEDHLVIQPRLNHLPFTLKFNVKSIVEEKATFKVFVGPKYDSYGNPIKFEDNWMNFVQLDWFTQILNKGENILERSSDEFYFYKQDAPATAQIYQLLGESKLPFDSIYKYFMVPNRLMLPRGTNGGYPLQFFVVVYKASELPKEYEMFKYVVHDDKPLGYPLDRPVSPYFFQPNMYFKDVVVYHKGSEYPTSFHVVQNTNSVPRH